jgi:hypothetical protein
MDPVLSQSLVSSHLAHQDVDATTSSPFSLLPSELISRIFLFASICDPRWAVRVVPLVCKLWKAEADAALPIWNEFVFQCRDVALSDDSIQAAQRLLYWNPKAAKNLSICCRRLPIQGYESIEPY